MKFLIKDVQKQPPGVFCKKMCCQKFRTIHRKTPVQETLFRPQPATLFKNSLWHRCFPVNFAKFLRTPFLQNTSGRLLLDVNKNIKSPQITFWCAGSRCSMINKIMYNSQEDIREGANSTSTQVLANDFYKYFQTHSLQETSYSWFQRKSLTGDPENLCPVPLFTDVRTKSLDRLCLMFSFDQ